MEECIKLPLALPQSMISKVDSKTKKAKKHKEKNNNTRIWVFFLFFFCENWAFCSYFAPLLHIHKFINWYLRLSSPYIYLYVHIIWGVIHFNLKSAILVKYMYDIIYYICCKLVQVYLEAKPWCHLDGTIKSKAAVSSGAEKGNDGFSLASHSLSLKGILSWLEYHVSHHKTRYQRCAICILHRLKFRGWVGLGWQHSFWRI